MENETQKLYGSYQLFCEKILFDLFQRNVSCNERKQLEPKQAVVQVSKIWYFSLILLSGISDLNKKTNHVHRTTKDG
jgi:hypothetical protein